MWGMYWTIQIITNKLEIEQRKTVPKVVSVMKLYQDVLFESN